MPTESDPIQFDDIDMTSEWVEESENPSPTQWLDRFGSALDGGDLNTRQFSAAIVNVWMKSDSNVSNSAGFDCLEGPCLGQARC
ncbi:hypothetical protein GOBAR_DD32177 [Gossypium barbadense]|nr:hypothetical protein GOBAR_DD32177 [Gossypium barbadense]